LGFDGKSVINPRQIKIVHDIFTPSARDIKNALAVVRAMREANAKGSGVVALKGKMIDKPVLARAERMLDLARAAGIRFEEDEESAG
jgi:citrate lyase subunit beta/citryl-CoA lyase